MKVSNLGSSFSDTHTSFAVFEIRAKNFKTNYSAKVFAIEYSHWQLQIALMSQNHYFRGEITHTVLNLVQRPGSLFFHLVEENAAYKQGFVSNNGRKSFQLYMGE